MATIPTPVAAGHVSTSGFSYTNSGANTISLDGDIYLGNPSGSPALEFNNAAAGTTGAWTVTIKGGAFTYYGYAVNFLNNLLPSGKNTLTVTADGAVSGGTTGVYATSLTDVVNNGSIFSHNNGIVYDGINPDNSLNTASGVINTKILTVTNNAGAEILADWQPGFGPGVEVFAIGNYSGALLKVINSGTVFGAQSVFVDADGKNLDDTDYEGAAIRSDGGLTLTNNATGEIHGGVESGWVKNTVINSGKIYGTVNFWLNGAYIDGSGVVDMDRDGLFNDTTGAVASSTLINTVTNNTNARIEGAWDYAYDNAGTDVDTDDDAKFQVALDLNVGVDKVTNNGIIQGSVWTGRDNDTLTNGLTGEIHGRVKMGDGDDIVTNSGNIFRNDNKNAFNDLNSLLYVESGVDLGNGKNTLTNSGQIEGTVNGGTGDDTITNALTGRILGDISGGDGKNIISNLGTLDGNIITGDAGSASGVLMEKITNSGLVMGNISTGNGDRTITNSGQIGGTVSTGTGNDTLINSKDIKDSVDLGNGNNTATNAGTLWNGIWTGTGRDVITNTGVVQNGIHSGDGNDKIINSKTVFGDLDTDNSVTSGSDEVQNSGTVFGDVDVSHGGSQLLSDITGNPITADYQVHNLFKNTGAVYGNVYAGSGIDNIINSKLIDGDIMLYDGLDFVTNSGTINGDVVTDDGGSTVVNTGTINGDVIGGAGVDALTNKKMINGNVTLGDNGDVSNETLDNALGIIKGTIELGGGADTLKGGAGAETVNDQNGSDTYLMGAGDDVMIASNDTAADIFDGGTGKDTLDFSLAGTNIVVDLSNTTTANISFAGNPEVDKVKNVEVIIGTSLGDVLTGSTLADTLDGGEGADTIKGGGGADKLYAGVDAVTDTFIYSLASESGVTKATRDVIFGFDDTKDVLQLDFDSNTVNAGVDHTFSLLSMNNTGGFTGTVGQIRAYQHGSQTIVEADTNGDGKADWSVALDGVHTLTAGNFDWTP
ncbi:MAG: calcium-binding protein [Hyphomicrobiales bacterium]